MSKLVKVITVLLLCTLLISDSFTVNHIKLKPQQTHKPPQTTNVGPDFLLPRPKLYSGLQTKTKNPLYFGTMWNQYEDEQGYFIRLRETLDYNSIEVNTKVERADPLTFSKVVVTDNYHMNTQLNFTWVKYPNQLNNFALRITGESLYDVKLKEKRDSRVAVYFYIGLADGIVNDPILDKNGELVLTGKDNFYGGFTMSTSYLNAKNLDHKVGFESAQNTFYFSNQTNQPYYASAQVVDMLQSGVSNKNSPACCLGTSNHRQLLPNMKFGQNGRNNLIVIQKILETPFDWLVVFENTENPLNQEQKSLQHVEQIYNSYKEQFEKKFDETYSIGNFARENNLNEMKYREFALQTFSSLINGLSYFEGTGFMKNMSNPTQPVIVLQDRKLLSLIPCKSAFPRAFYWDEAFQEMLQMRWNRDIFEEVAYTWHFESILDPNTGWIAREQFIGDEARFQQPEGAWYGLNNQMNPPVFFITIERYVEMTDKARVYNYFTRTGLFERLEKVFHWYLTTMQAKNSEPYTFIWNGRIADCSVDSGLDDYPRFDTFEEGESDVDIQAWMGKAALVMTNLAVELKKPVDRINYYRDLSYKIVSNLRNLYWNENIQFYVDKSTKFGLNSHIGVPGMLPICLNLEINETRIEKTIEKMSSTEFLFSEGHGLLSLSFKDPKFRRTGNYWRGNIWSPVQYICARGLYKYEKQGIRSAGVLRQKIQNGFAQTVFNNYRLEDPSIGAIYETYHPYDGRGYNNYPFTGWTSLVVLLMAEDYQ
ncbi:hypothetical protein ABK040_004827 [Willaertia magna]